MTFPNSLFFATVKYTESEIRQRVTITVIVTALITLAASSCLFWLIYFLATRKKHIVYFGDIKKTVVRHNRIVPLICPQKEGYTFCGWYRDEKLNIRWNPTDIVVQEMYLYPKWEKNSEPEKGGEQDV